MLAHLAPAALRATIAIAPVGDRRFPAVQVPIWALITYPPDFPAILWCDTDGTQVSIGSMVPLLLKIWIKTADVWAVLLHTCMLALIGVTPHLKPLVLHSACIGGHAFNLAATCTTSHKHRGRCFEPTMHFPMLWKHMLIRAYLEL